MCGIAGIVDTFDAVQPEVVAAMCRAIAHRGPDHAGQYVHSSQGLSVGLGSQRLSIIDLSEAGNQPICNEAEDIWIVYNGELYNHVELRRDLELRGHHYRSHSDTETIVHAYEEYGLDCLSRFNGMFAFALYDLRRNQVVLARDPMGIKPLYYRWHKGQLAFSSELQGLLRAFPDHSFTISAEALSLFMSLGYVPSPNSLFTGIEKLPPGAYMILKDRQLHVSSYWHPRPNLQNGAEGIGLTDAVQQTRALVDAAVKRQMMSDVPVGAFLSGGLDSSIVSMLAQRHHTQPLDTFSVGFADEGGKVDTDNLYNQDLVFARIVAKELGTHHHEVIIPADETIATQFEAALRHMDEPVWETSYISIQLMAKLARATGVKVILTGDGGDELFAGYPWYAGFARFLRLRRLPFLRAGLPLLGRVAGNSVLGIKARDLRLRLDHDDVGLYKFLHAVIADSLKDELIHKAYADRLDHDPVRPMLEALAERTQPRDLLEWIAIADLALWVREHFNQRVDRMTAMHSVEARVPLQDLELVQFALGVPMQVKMNQGQSKYLLRAAFGADLPQAIMTRPKRPFSTPTWTWLRGPLRAYVMDLLSPDSIRSGALLNAEPVHQLVTSFMNGDDSHAFRVWALVNLVAWQRVNHAALATQPSTSTPLIIQPTP